MKLRKILRFSTLAISQLFSVAHRVQSTSMAWCQTTGMVPPWKDPRCPKWQQCGHWHVSIRKPWFKVFLQWDVRHQDTLGLENADRVGREEVEVISQKVGKSFIYFKGEKKARKCKVNWAFCIWAALLIPDNCQLILCCCTTLEGG